MTTMVFILVMVAAHLQPAQEVPLVAPTPRLQAPPRHKKPPAAPAPVAAPLPTPQISPEARRERAVLLGLKVGVLPLTPGPLEVGGMGGIELAYRLPFAHRFFGVGVELWLAAAFGSLATPLGRQRASAFLLGAPVWLSGNVSLGPGLLRVMAGAQVDAIDAHLTLAGLHDNQTGIGLAFVCGAAYLFELGPGGLGLEARYSYLPYGAGGVTYGASAFFLMLDYSLFL